MTTAGLSSPRAGPGAGDGEAALQSFLATLPEDVAVPARTLAHAWSAAGGTFQAGRLTCRLLAQAPNGQSYTAATLHGVGPSGVPRLEVGRVLIVTHGVGAGDWTQWCDDCPELAAHGFDRNAKYPTIALAGLPPAVVARLALGLRDLCRLAQGQPA